MSIRTLVVQPASFTVVHCYIGQGAPFDTDSAVAKAIHAPGIERAHLVTSNRPPANWCLVVEPVLVVEQSNAEALRLVMAEVGRRLGCGGMTLRRALTRPKAERGIATDVFDWLK